MLLTKYALSILKAKQILTITFRIRHCNHILSENTAPLLLDIVDYIGVLASQRIYSEIQGFVKFILAHDRCWIVLHVRHSHLDLLLLAVQGLEIPKRDLLLHQLNLLVYFSDSLLSSLQLLS
jgi:hypothetical protein